jgi:ketosteroid isomerase-like protein
MSQENVKIVRRLFEAFREGMERGDAGAWFDSEYLADDAEWVYPPAMGLGTYRGRGGFLEFMRVWTEDFEGWSAELERVIDVGDDGVVGLLRQSAVGKASGATVELHGAVIYELDGRRVVRMRSFRDAAEAFEAVGVSE